MQAARRAEETKGDGHAGESSPRSITEPRRAERPPDEPLRARRSDRRSSEVLERSADMLTQLAAARGGKRPPIRRTLSAANARLLVRWLAKPPTKPRLNRSTPSKCYRNIVF